MAKKAVRKKRGANQETVADRHARERRDLLGRSVRGEKKIIALSKQLRRLIERRDTELQVLNGTIDIFRGTRSAANGEGNGAGN